MSLTNASEFNRAPQSSTESQHQLQHEAPENRQFGQGARICSHNWRVPIDDQLRWLWSLSRLAEGLARGDAETPAIVKRSFWIAPRPIILICWQPA